MIPPDTVQTHLHRGSVQEHCAEGERCWHPLWGTISFALFNIRRPPSLNSSRPKRKEKLLFVSDLFTPGTPVDAANTSGIDNAAALYTAVTGQKLEVDRIVGGHGDIAPLRDLVKVAAMKQGS